MAKHTTRRRRSRKTVVNPLHEAALLAYIAMYYNCTKELCWPLIADAIATSGKTRSVTVYRGHLKANPTITLSTPFFSTSPSRAMAELFVEKDWSKEPATDIGYLFKIHLLNVPTISTRDVKYTYTDEVYAALKDLNQGKIIEKGSGDYTFENFWPRMEESIASLVFETTEANNEEILVLNGGTFYKDGALTKPGYKKINAHEFETWYSF